MPVAHVNLSKIPEEVERPIPQTMRYFLDWDFSWLYYPGEALSPPSVRAHLNTEFGPVYLRWENINDHWYVATVQVPGWSRFRPEGPKSARGAFRWLTKMQVPKDV